MIIYSFHSFIVPIIINIYFIYLYNHLAIIIYLIIISYYLIIISYYLILHYVLIPIELILNYFIIII